MSKKSTHEFVSRTYDPDNSIYRSARESAFGQIEEFLAQRKDQKTRIIEFGIGPGELLSRVAKLEGDFDFTGVDLSEGMLKRAAEKVPLRTIQCSATEIGPHVEGEKFDLIIVHFLLAYVNLAEFLKVASPLLAEGGVISIVTSTNETLTDPESGISTLIGKMKTAKHPLRRWAAGLIENGIQQTTTPDDIAQIKSAIEPHGLQIRNRTQGRFPMQLDNGKDAYEHCVEDGWFVNGIPTVLLSIPLLAVIVQKLLNLAYYPIHWPHVVETVIIEQV